MSTQSTGTRPDAAPDETAEPRGGETAAMDAGTYEVLRDRLAALAGDLARGAEELNARRVAAFGSTGLRLLGTERLHTAHSCVPRDLVAVGGHLLLGYDTPPGLRSETTGSTPGDVFTLRTLRRDGDRTTFGDTTDGSLPGLLDDPSFAREFGELYRYYRAATLLRLRHVDGKLLAVFRTGPHPGDLRVLRWRLDADGMPHYLDARGERDHVLPPSHDVEWTPATRDDHVLGRHPHVAIGDDLYVSTVGGSLTVKTENTTETGDGIYSEPVDDPLQSLADADIEHARTGPLVLLRVRPYNETAWRHLVLNTTTATVARLDGIGQACLRLPDDQGIIFPGGYHLATGTAKTFDTDAATPDEALVFERSVRSPNGEDILYVFHAPGEGRALLLSYNLIRKEVATPLACHGYALFDDGTLVTLRADAGEASRAHAVQTWQSPYASDTHAAGDGRGGAAGTGPLERVGNPDLVRGISECLTVARMAAETTTPTTAVFEAVVAACTRVADRFHWLADPELGGLRGPLTEVRTTAEQVLAEFETVRTLTRRAADALEETAAHTASLVRRVRGESPRTADAWVGHLTALRQAQGRLTTLRDTRYADAGRVDALAAEVEGDIAATARRAVDFLRQDDAFAGYEADVARLTADAEAIETVAAAVPVTESLDEKASGLEVLTEVVAGLEIGDATARTAILERVAGVLGGVNRARATLTARRRELLDHEGRAAFAAEFALLQQAVTGALAASGTPEACEEQLARLLLRLENLEARFAEHDDFLTALSTKRTDVHEAFSSRKQTLQDARARRAERLADSATRILATVHRRALTLADLDAVNTYFASDPMVAKVRRTADELRELGDPVRADELDGRVKAVRQEAGRALRDRTDLYADGGETIRLGRHRFTVNTQATEVTLVPHEDGLAFALTGTDYRSPVTDPGFEATRPYWDQLLPSETAEVYRAEHLAAKILTESAPGALAQAGPAALADLVRAAADAAYDEGYERGVHDHDATAILAALLRLRDGAGLLRYPPDVRAAAQLFWTHGAGTGQRAHWTLRARSLARARATFGTAPAIADLTAELAAAIMAFEEFVPAVDTGEDTALAAEYLFEELIHEPEGFATGAGARTLIDAFRRATGGGAYDEELRALGTPGAGRDDHATVHGGLAARRQLVRAWLGSYAAAQGADTDPGDLAEAVAVELCPDTPRYTVTAPLTEIVDGLLGTHPRVSGRRLTVRLDELLARTRRFRDERAPGFRAYRRRRDELVAAERARLRVEEFTPRVMSAFVRNRLLDEVYLPLIGGNLAKQLGAAGDAQRTDHNGLLLLVSPPGYGKTTLMEYVADRLGLLFVKVSGPALGHAVTSLDPAEAPDATARREVEKINFALEAGSNTLLYLDDIQHTSPELLQKFISLCDAQRRIEGVQNGRPRTYDLRGKRFAVCMAGNPYTESGGRFRIPDMLANRADVWNLGDVLSGKEDVFALSFIENALTSNPVLAPLAGRERADLELLVRLAEGDPAARADRLAHPYAPAELDRVLAVLRHLLTARRTVLAVNAAYIASAARTDATRTEPPFLLQGSYRNMNKIAERVVPVMNDAELAAVIDDHYAGEAQTLTSDAEANLLKLAELRGTLTPEQAARRAAITSAYLRTQALGGPDDDPLTRAVAALGLLADRVAAVETAITRASTPGAAPAAIGPSPDGSRQTGEGRDSYSRV
ncbi:DNA repair ATPase [Streptomyces syringium]|uniref:DNA repair ATPase n=1 Tax=Streptomyces syringium TaxID=76729 RepID=UPI003F55E5AE